MRLRRTLRGWNWAAGLVCIFDPSAAYFGSFSEQQIGSDIGPAAIREFVGSLGEHKANKGVFITSGGFTSGARDAAAKAHSRIVLIDGDQLADFMIDHGVGVTGHKT